MKSRLLFWIGPLIALLWIVSSLSSFVREAPALRAMSCLPVLADGRIKPLGTVARNALLIIHGRETFRLAGGKVMPPGQWLAELLFNAPSADTRPVFLINNPEVQALFGWEKEGKKFFAFEDLEPSLALVDAQGEMAASLPSAKRSPYQISILNLRNALYLYQRLKNSLRPAGAYDFTAEVEAFRAIAPAGAAALSAKRAGKPSDPGLCEEFLNDARRYGALSETALLRAIPPSTDASKGEWEPLGEALLTGAIGGDLSPFVTGYATTGDAWRRGDAGLFGAGVSSLAALFSTAVPGEARHALMEESFNLIDPFHLAMGLYVLSFLLVAFYWLRGDASLRKGAIAVTLVALLLHTLGLAARMWLQGRPPVTNLYSSAIFIGWFTVMLGLLLERFQRDGVGAACSSVVGFVTLVIAHHLAGRGDTLEMLQAVLDTNIWLATHVVAITIGYSAMFLAGMLAIIFVLRGVITPDFTREKARSLGTMIYGVLCFATLFSFVGTVLGGIWADQSWGRFWGWDPKENGALLIVLWCAITLHARLAGYIRERGLAMMALFGNIVTAFSWFGVNMLGVGLHSYGFMDRALPWLAGFIGLQIALVVLALWHDPSRRNPSTPR